LVVRLAVLLLIFTGLTEWPGYRAAAQTAGLAEPAESSSAGCAATGRVDVTLQVSGASGRPGARDRLKPGP
jgi:hypothetical protein